MPLLFERVVIAGVGLIGGSLALAARKAGLVGEIVGLGRSNANLELAKQRGIIDRYTQNAAEAAAGADLLVLAVPVRSLAAVAAACAPSLSPQAIVSDVGSVKASVIGEVEAVLPAGIRFVGAHPIAGTEDSGAAAARSDLFSGARCIVTPGPSSTAAATQKVRALWEGVGMRVDEMDAAQHDRLLAWVSHLPHAIAFSAVSAVLDCDAAMAAYGGPSFRDLTRVAASSAETWRDIFMANRDAVTAAIDDFMAALSHLRAAIAEGSEERLTQAIARVAQARRKWSGEA